MISRYSIFCRVVESGSFTRTARELGCSQSAVSQAVRALEKELNLQVAITLRDALEQSGARVILTRDTDMEFSRGKRDDLTARLDLAREGKADLLVSIHMNEYRSRNESGPQVF